MNILTKESDKNDLKFHKIKQLIFFVGVVSDWDPAQQEIPDPACHPAG